MNNDLKKSIDELEIAINETNEKFDNITIDGFNLDVRSFIEGLKKYNEE